MRAKNISLVSLKSKVLTASFQHLSLVSLTRLILKLFLNLFNVINHHLYISVIQIGNYQLNIFYKLG